MRSSAAVLVPSTVKSVRYNLPALNKVELSKVRSNFDTICISFDFLKIVVQFTFTRCCKTFSIPLQATVHQKCVFKIIKIC